MPRFHFDGDASFLLEALANSSLPAETTVESMRRGRAFAKLANLVANASQLDDPAAQEALFLEAEFLLDEMRAVLKAASTMLAWAEEQAGAKERVVLAVGETVGDLGDGANAPT